MKISVLVPFGADDSPAGKQRAAVWRFNSRRWDKVRAAGLVDEIILGIDPLGFQLVREEDRAHEVAYGVRHPLTMADRPRHPFSVSRALNDAAKRARGDVFLMFGADHVPDPAVIGWAREQIKRHPWVRLHELVLYATPAATHLMVNGPFDRLLTDSADWVRHSAPCPGVLALTRDVFETAGGMDERFAGWGYEDTEFLSRLHHFVPGGQMQPCGLPLRELHVPSNRDLRAPNYELFAKITQERGW